MSDHTDFIGGPTAEYVDQITIVYNSVEHRGDSTPRATVVLIVDAGTTVDHTKLRAHVDQLHYTPTPIGGPIHSSFISKERYRKTSGGAAGASLEIIVWATTSAARARCCSEWSARATEV